MMEEKLNYHFWHNTTYLGKNDVVKNTGHPSRSRSGYLQAKIRPCDQHQSPDLIWYGSCSNCYENYEKDNEWMWDYG